MCPQTFLHVQKSPSFSVFLPPDHSFLSVLLSHLSRDLYKAFQSLGRGIFIICSKQEMIKNRALEKKRKSEREVEERWRGRREPNKRKGRKIVFSGLFPGEHPGSKPRTCSFQQQLNCPWELCHRLPDKLSRNEEQRWQSSPEHVFLLFVSFFYKSSKLSP